MCNQNDQSNKIADDRILAKSSSNDKLNGGCASTTLNKLNQATMPKPIRNDKIDMNFDHLSVVSEECLSGSEEQSNNKIESKNDPIEGVEESIYTNFQSTVPPLQHFENLSYKDIGPSLGKDFFFIHSCWGKEDFCYMILCVFYQRFFRRNSV